MRLLSQIGVRVQGLVDGGDLSGARRALEEAYAAGQRVGPGDPQMVLLAYDLAVVAEELANRHEARKNFGLVSQFGPGALGEDHPAVVRARDYLAVGSADESAPTTQFPPMVSEQPAVVAPEPGPVPAPGNPFSAAPPMPVAGAPPAGAPLSAVAPEPGPVPAPGNPFAAAPLSAQPGNGDAFSVPPGDGGAFSASGVPVSGAPVSAAPISITPFPGVAEPAPSNGRARVPWIVAAAATVLAVVMVVVVLARPGAQQRPDNADAAVFDGVPASAGGPGDYVASAGPSSGPASSAPASSAPPVSSAPTSVAATTVAPKVAAPTTAAAVPPKAAAVVTRIVAPLNGAGVSRRFTVKFTVSASDVSATSTRLGLSECVKEWCFLDGPVTVQGGVPQDYGVTLGPADGEGIGEAWTVRVDRLPVSTYNELMAQKQAAIDNGTWGNGVTTPTAKLNSTPVSKVVVTKTS